jgi:segregation and condensation protein B
MAKQSGNSAGANRDFALPPPAGETSGLALDQLGAALVGMLGGGADPYSQAPNEARQGEAPAQPPSATGDEACEITPRSIFEAMLFVGHPRNEPLSARHVAGLMRGVRPEEIDVLARELNEGYLRRNCPYTIVRDGGGYRLALREEYARLRDKFYGRLRRARLSQAAIEVLAAVAYHEPITADDVTRLRGTASGHVLAHLVRRQLLRLERPGRGRAVYYTTPRFLALFGLESLADLPRSGELEQP